MIVASYIGSWLMAGAYLSVGACISALTKNQVIAFVATLVVCLLFTLAGFPLVLDAFSGWAPVALVELVSSLSFLSHFQAISKGVLAANDVIYFIVVIAAWLVAGAILIDLKKAE